MVKKFHLIKHMKLKAEKNLYLLQQLLKVEEFQQLLTKLVKVQKLYNLLVTKLN